MHHDFTIYTRQQFSVIKLINYESSLMTALCVERKLFLSRPYQKLVRALEFVHEEMWLVLLKFMSIFSDMPCIIIPVMWWGQASLF